MRPAFEDHTPESLGQAVELHFAGMIAAERPLTIEGLAYALGVDRHTLKRYADHRPGTGEGEQTGDGVRDEHCATIKKAYTRCETWLAEKLHTGGSPVGAIFALKCGYKWQETPVQIQGVGGFKMVVDTSAGDGE